MLCGFLSTCLHSHRAIYEWRNGMSRQCFEDLCLICAAVTELISEVCVTGQYDRISEIRCSHLRGFQIPLHRGEENNRRSSENTRTSHNHHLHHIAVSCWRHPFLATEEEAYHYDKPMNGLENGKEDGGRLTHTLVAQWRPPSLLPLLFIARSPLQGK